jgi:hypothetical protein
MRPLLSLLLLVTLSSAAFAGEITKGAAMQVKPNSIWFQNNAELAHWQNLKQASNAKALAAYEKKVLGNRDAWQFIYPLDVKILDYAPAQHRVSVEMTTDGRMKGTDWVLDPDALAL